MRIVHENFENETYIDILLSDHEFELIQDFMVVSDAFSLNGEIFNIGVKISLPDYPDEEE